MSSRDILAEAVGLPPAETVQQVQQVQHIPCHKYTIIQAGDITELAKLVNEAIAAGNGVPIGGVCSFTIENRNSSWGDGPAYVWHETRFCQALAV